MQACLVIKDKMCNGIRHTLRSFVIGGNDADNREEEKTNSVAMASHI